MRMKPPSFEDHVVDSELARTSLAHIANGLKQASIAEPVDPSQGCVFDQLQASPWTLSPDHATWPSGRQNPKPPRRHDQPAVGPESRQKIPACRSWPYLFLTLSGSIWLYRQESRQSRSPSNRPSCCVEQTFWRIVPIPSPTCPSWHSEIYWNIPIARPITMPHFADLKPPTTSTCSRPHFYPSA